MGLRYLVSVLCMTALGAGADALAAAEVEPRNPIDRILAVVDDDPILASEIEQILAFGVIEPADGEADDDTRRRALDFLIEERLRFHEVDRFGFAEVPVDVVDAEFERLESQFGGPDKFRQVLDDLGLDEQGARQLLARQVMIWVYVEERLGARIFVGLEDIRQYYDEDLVPRLVEGGQGVPPLDEVREAIRSVLREQRMNEELERWTTELLQTADIEDYFDSNFKSLPPHAVILRSDSE